MTRAELDHFRQRLRDERAVVARRIGDARAQAREPAEEGAHDEGDDAVRDVAVDTTLDVGELRTRRLEDIDDALLRVELGQYGICEACGRPIEIDRLEAMPSARFCKDDAHRTDVARPARL